MSAPRVPDPELMSQEERIYQDRLDYHRADFRARRAVEQENDLEATWAELTWNPNAYDPSDTGYRFMTLSQLRSKPKPMWQVEGLISQSSICVIGGPTNIGKTFVAVDLTAHIALGRKWEGREVVKGRVGYLIAEGSEFFPDRVTAWEQYNGQTVPESEYILHDGQGFNLSNPSAVRDMCITVARQEIDVLVIDTLSQLGGLTNENDNAQMAAAVKAAALIRRARPGCTVIIIHHANTQGLLRGAKALWADVDTVLMVAPAKGAKGKDSETSKGTFLLSTEVSHGGKQRNAATVTIPGWHLEDFGPSKVAVRLAMTHDPYRERILAVLADGQPYVVADFKAKWDDPSGKWDDRRYRTAIEKLLKEELVIQEGVKRGAKYTLARQS